MQEPSYMCNTTLYPYDFRMVQHDNKSSTQRFSHFDIPTKSHTIELSIESLKEGRNHGFDISLRKLSIKSSLAHCVSEPLLKVGAKIGTSSFHLLNLRGFKDLKKGMLMGPTILKHGLANFQWVAQHTLG